MTMNAQLLQDSFKTASFSVSSSSTLFHCTKYDIRVVAKQLEHIGADAFATITKIQPFTISSSPTIFVIPTNEETMNGQTTYKATLRLYSSGQVIQTFVGEFYYDLRPLSIDKITVHSNPNPDHLANQPTYPNFSHTRPIVRVTESEEVNYALDPNAADIDPFFSYVKINNVYMSGTTVLPTNDADIFDSTIQHYLGERPYSLDANHKYYWRLDDEANAVPIDTAVELWGHVDFVLADSFESSFIPPTFTFALEFRSEDDHIGYHLPEPEVILALGDVVGAVSEHPVIVTVENFESYNIHKFDSLTLVIKPNASSNTILYEGSKNLADFSTGPNSNQVRFTAADFDGVMNATPSVLVNGEPYHFKVLLNFTNETIYKPSQHRGVSFDNLIFKDSLNHIVEASVENSWQLDLLKPSGLVVSFKKTDQFLGNNQVLTYNLDVSGNTTVKAEYSTTFDDFTNSYTNWQVISGGSIQQGSPNYTLNAANVSGVYVVPRFTTGPQTGPEQPNVYIYAVIPNQNQYRIVKVRLTLTTTNGSFSSQNQVSESYYIPPQQGYTYNVNNNVLLNAALDVLITAYGLLESQINLVNAAIAEYEDNGETPPSDLYSQRSGFESNISILESDISNISPSFRYFPAPERHVFATYKPFIPSVDDDLVNFNVPVNVPPYFMSNVVTDANTNGSTSPVTNPGAILVAGNYQYNYMPEIVSGLSYLPEANESFQLSVSYVYTEFTDYEIDASMTVQLQGFPSNLTTPPSFAIATSEWDTANQRAEYQITVNTTNSTAERMDGWNVYTKLESEDESAWISYGNVLKGEASYNLSVNYAMYSTFIIKFVATRSIYLDIQNQTQQVELVDGIDTSAYATATINIVPDELPRPSSDDISLSNLVYDLLGSENQNATMSVTLPSTSTGVRITNLADSSTIN